MTLDVADFSDPLPVRCIRPTPEAERVEVEIIAINIQAKLGDAL